MVSGTAQPGVYVVRLGNFIVGPSTLTGEGVTIYLQGDATIQMHGSADVELSTPTARPLAGVVIVSDRDPATRGRRVRDRRRGSASSSPIGSR